MVVELVAVAGEGHSRFGSKRMQTTAPCSCPSPQRRRVLIDGRRNIGRECLHRLVLFCAVSELAWRHTGPPTEDVIEVASSSETAPIRDAIQRQARIPKLPLCAVDSCAEEMLVQRVTEHLSDQPGEFPGRDLKVAREFADSRGCFAGAALPQVRCNRSVQIRIVGFQRYGHERSFLDILPRQVVTGRSLLLPSEKNWIAASQRGFTSG